MARNGEIPGLLDFQSFDDTPTVQNDDLERPKYNARSAFSQMTSRLPNTAHTCSKVVEAPLPVRASEPTSSAHTNNLVDYSWDDPLSMDFEANNRAENSSIKNNFDSRNENIDTFHSFKNYMVPRICEYKSKARKSQVNAPIHIGASKTPSQATLNDLVDCSWDDPLLMDFKATKNEVDNLMVKNTLPSKNNLIEPLNYFKDNAIPSLHKYQSNAKTSQVNAPMCNCASENSSSTHSTNQVDYNWDDALSQAFKAMSIVR
ncbi:hypothetical protein EB796_005255 [Bugula neritina]|uniref:Uncharacterized protein n=1 Tax=Bugula neritina TaxID=10212 RepID=A0A7J7KFM7_BUGNE|nr:hypothetical protein EB796_005255 [Bugula neritina]